MSLTVRVFLVDESDGVHPLPLARFERLNRGDSGESLPEYSGQRLRLALAAVEICCRKPIAIRKIFYSYLPIDGSGRVDQEEVQRHARLAIEAHAWGLSEPAVNDVGAVIDATPRFFRKRLLFESTWKPSKRILHAVAHFVLGAA